MFPRADPRQLCKLLDTSLRGNCAEKHESLTLSKQICISDSKEGHLVETIVFTELDLKDHQVRSRGYDSKHAASHGRKIEQSWHGINKPKNVAEVRSRPILRQAVDKALSPLL